MSRIISKKANLLLDAKAILGEGPVWDWRKQLLFWVDIEGYTLQQHNPSSGKNTRWHFDEMIGAVVPMENGNLLLAMEKGLASFALENEQLTVLELLENSDPSIRFNDGKVGPNGNFWIGTMEKNCALTAGNLYRVSSDKIASCQIPNTSISNGLAWTSNKKTLYYIDSVTFTIQAFDYNLRTSSISNPKAVITVPEGYGAPDGMCIDTDDMLWIAHWGGSCIRRWNPNTGNVLERIDIPAPHVTSCCFGGEDLKTLYITTARSGLNATQLQKFPLSGGLFTCKPGASGKQINYFKD